MTDSPVVPTPPPASLASRLIGVLLSPAQAYTSVVATPRALGALAVVVLVVALTQGAFLATAVGQEALLDQQVRALESFGVTITDQMYTGLEAGLSRAPYTTAVSQAVFLPLMAAIVAGLLMGLFSLLMGGTATFRQVYAIVAHSGVIIAVQSVFSMPLSYTRGAFAGANLAVFVPMLEETSFAVRFLGAIDLFVIWWAVSLAIGIGVLYRRRPSGLATGLVGVYVLLAFILAIVRSGN
jgi:hypothetical protein